MSDRRFFRLRAPTATRGCPLSPARLCTILLTLAITASRPSLCRAAAAGRQSRLPVQFPGRLPAAGHPGRPRPRFAALHRHSWPSVRVARAPGAGGAAAGARVLVRLPRSVSRGGSGPRDARPRTGCRRRQLPGPVRRRVACPVLTNAKLAARTIAALLRGLRGAPFRADAHAALCRRAPHPRERGRGPLGGPGRFLPRGSRGCRRTSGRRWRITSAAASTAATWRRPATCRRSNAQAESFSLANIVPQNRVLNRGLWADIEESVRRLASRRGSIFVVTGIIFSGDAVQQIKGGVLVPTQLFKALYDPASGAGGAYLVRNDGSRDWRTVSIDELGREAGIDVFPGLPARRPDRRHEPARSPHLRPGRRHRPRHAETWQDWLQPRGRTARCASSSATCCGRSSERDLCPEQARRPTRLRRSRTDSSPSPTIPACAPSAPSRFENGTDRIALHGSLEIRRDKAGLAQA